MHRLLLPSRLRVRSSLSLSLSPSPSLALRSSPASTSASAGTGNVFRRRYFVLKDGRLFYFKTWEDYGSGGKATNLKEPIEMRRSMLT